MIHHFVLFKHVGNVFIECCLSIAFCSRAPLGRLCAKVIQTIIFLYKYAERLSESTVVLSMVGMAPKKNGHPYNSIATNELKSLLIYTDMFKYTHTF